MLQLANGKRKIHRNQVGVRPTEKQSPHKNYKLRVSKWNPASFSFCLNFVSRVLTKKGIGTATNWADRPLGHLVPPHATSMQRKAADGKQEKETIATFPKKFDRSICRFTGRTESFISGFSFRENHVSASRSSRIIISISPLCTVEFPITYLTTRYLNVHQLRNGEGLSARADQHDTSLIKSPIEK